MNTIYALATAPGRAGIAIVRASGPRAAQALEVVAGKVPRAREAAAVRIRNADGALIDHGLALWFPAPASATGEDVAEFHIHGGTAVVDAVQGALALVPGLRIAEAGEFTRRAFSNGKLDLTQVEALADLIAAETEGQHRQAARQLDGDLGRLMQGWRNEVLRALAHVEAIIDFSEEELPDSLVVDVTAGLQRLVPEMKAVVRGAAWGERLRSGIHVALIGAPNVGKSCLLNRLTRREAAIVSDTAGTTRDVVEVHLNLNGIPFTLADTAGLRDGVGPVEEEGVRRAEARGAAADMRLAVFDGGEWPRLHSRTERLLDEATIVVVNKSDLLSGRSVPRTLAGQSVCFVSAKTGEGMVGLMRILEQAAGSAAPAGEAPVLTRGRHREALIETVDQLQRFLDSPQDRDLELRAADLRFAARSLGRITGHVDVEDVLDSVFAEFCIGK